MTIIYIYPDNLKAKATLWLWELRDVGVIGAGLVLPVLILVKWGFSAPLAGVCLYAVLTIRLEGVSILDFLRWAADFFFLKQQYYEWRPRIE